MAIDLTGGMSPAIEQVFAECPDNPELRESVSFWVLDDSGVMCLPRVGIEAVAANWQEHGLQVNIALPMGVYSTFERMPLAGLLMGLMDNLRCLGPVHLAFLVWNHFENGECSLTVRLFKPQRPTLYRVRLMAHQ